MGGGPCVFESKLVEGVEDCAEGGIEGSRDPAMRRLSLPSPVSLHGYGNSSGAATARAEGQNKLNSLYFGPSSVDCGWTTTG